MISTTIPSPGGPLLCGQILAGQGICGTARPADTWEDYPLGLPDGNAEVIVTAGLNATVVVEVTGYLDLAPDTGTVGTGVTLFATDTPVLGLVDGEATTHLDVIIKEDVSGQLLCGQAICGVPPYLCGHLFWGQRWNNWSLDLDGDYGVLTFTVNSSILVEETGVLDLAGSSADVHFDFVLNAVDSVLELDGGLGIVNPILLPFVCLDLDLAAVTCTPLDLAPVTAEEVDLEALVCLEA